MTPSCSLSKAWPAACCCGVPSRMGGHSSVRIRLFTCRWFEERTLQGREEVGRRAVPGGLMRHGTGHNNGHDGPRALRARDLVLRSWDQELTNCFDSQLGPHPLCELGQGTPLRASDSLSIKSGTAVPPSQ